MGTSINGCEWGKSKCVVATELEGMYFGCLVQVLAPKSQTLISPHLCSGWFIKTNIMNSAVPHDVWFPESPVWQRWLPKCWWGKDGFDTQAKTTELWKVITISSLKATITHQIPWVCFWRLWPQRGRCNAGCPREAAAFSWKHNTPLVAFLDVGALIRGNSWDVLP